MKPTTPLWLITKYGNAVLEKIVPLKKTELDGLQFYHFRREPPHDAEAFSAMGLEFHGRIKDLSGATAIDIGANIGSYTLRLAKRFAHIIAFEPNPICSRVLQINIASNKFQNVVVQQIALSDRNGTLPFYIRGGGASSLTSTHYARKHDKVIQVKVSRLDNFQNSVRRVDFIKIDAEGAELSILKGGISLLERFRPVLAVEVHCTRTGFEDSCGCETCKYLISTQHKTEVIGESTPDRPVHWVWATPKGL